MKMKPKLNTQFPLSHSGEDLIILQPFSKKLSFNLNGSSSNRAANLIWKKCSLGWRMALNFAQWGDKIGVGSTYYMLSCHISSFQLGTNIQVQKPAQHPRTGEMFHRLKETPKFAEKSGGEMGEEV